MTRRFNIVNVPVQLDKLIKHKNIVNHIKAQRLSGFGHVKKCQIPEQLRRYLNGIL